MSSTVRSYGFIGVLKTPVPEDDYEEFTEKLYDAKAKISISYDGLLVYLDYNKRESWDVKENIYGLFISNSSQGDPQDLINEATQHGLEIEVDTIRPYNCIWYNGSDPDMALLTKEEFLKEN